MQLMKVHQLEFDLAVYFVLCSPILNGFESLKYLPIVVFYVRQESTRWFSILSVYSCFFSTFPFLLHSRSFASIVSVLFLNGSLCWNHVASNVSLAGGSRVRGRRHGMPAPLSLPRTRVPS